MYYDKQSRQGDGMTRYYGAGNSPFFFALYYVDSPPMCIDCVQGRQVAPAESSGKGFGRTATLEILALHFTLLYANTLPC